ncbi:MAG: hypothetical protein E6Q34_11885 [Burkholderiaceae bacterium]|nr:MAG: hypothetical protein E6Q34_11885 [Burkholderiaceae bacterium]
MSTRRMTKTILATGGCLLASPCWASYTEGFATFMAFYYAIIAVAVSYPALLILCYFRAFRWRTALFAHVSVLIIGASILLFMAFQEARGSFPIALVITTILFLIAIAPSAIQYLYFQRKDQIAYKASVNGPSLAQIMSSGDRPARTTNEA